MTDFAAVPAPPPRRARIFRKIGRWLLFALAFLTPFFFLPITSDPVGINKLALAGALIAAALICLLGCVLDERRIDYPKSALTLFLFIFLAAQGLSTWLSIAPGQSFWGKLDAPDSFVSVLLYVLVFFLYFFFFREADIELVLGAMAGGLVVAAIFTFFVNPVGSALGWGILMIAIVAALVIVRPSELTRRNKIYFWVAALFALLSLVAVSDRSLWLTLAAYVTVLAAMRFGPRTHFQYAFAIIFVALFFALVSPRLPNIPRFTVAPSPDFAMSASAVKGTLGNNSPFTGTGPSTFDLDFATYKPATVNNTDFWNVSFPQGISFIVTLAATGGLLSLLIFLCLAVLICYPIGGMQSLDIKNAMLVSVSVFLTVALFLFPAFFTGFIFLFILLGLRAGVRSRRTFSFGDWSGWKSFSTSLLITILAAAVLAGAFFASVKYIAAVDFGRSNAAVAAGDSATAFDQIKDAIALDPADDYYRAASVILVQEARVLSAENNSTASAEVPIVIANALQAAEGATVENPHDPSNWGNLGSVYETVMPLLAGADVSAEESYARASTLDPVNPQWDVDIARVYMESASLLPAGSASSSATQRGNDLQNAQTFLQQAISLKDDYADPRVMLVELYLGQGNITEAIQKVQELKAQNPLDPGVAFELGYLYYQDGQYASAQEEFQVAAILEPNYVNAYYYLGLTEVAEGQTDQARSQFEVALQLDPANTQVEQALASLQSGEGVSTTTATSTLGGAQGEITLPSTSTKKNAL